MQAARMLGHYVGQLAEEKDLSISDLSRILGCTDTQTHSFLKGRAVLTFPQIEQLAKELGTTVEALLAGDWESYNVAIVHGDGFDDPAKREFILDLIDDYMDIADAVAGQE